MAGGGAVRGACILTARFIHDALAEKFFMPWAKHGNQIAQPLNLVVCTVIILIATLAPLILEKRAKRAKQSGPPEAPPRLKPDRFWRRFAVVIAAVVLLPIFIAVIGIVLAIVVPAVNRAHNHGAPLPPSPPSAPVPEGRTKFSTGNLVISPAVYRQISHQPGELSWGFNCFVPAGQQATFVFVRWINGVPHIAPGLRAYYLVSGRGGIDVPFCSISCYPVLSNTLAADLKMLGVQRSKEAKRVGKQHQRRAMECESRPWIYGKVYVPMPSYQAATPKLAHELPSGYQCSIPLVTESETHSDAAELRVFLTPVVGPVLRVRPSEIDHTNYVAGSGLPWDAAETLVMLDTIPNKK